MPARAAVVDSLPEPDHCSCTSHVMARRVSFIHAACMSRDLGHNSEVNTWWPMEGNSYSRMHAVRFRVLAVSSDGWSVPCENTMPKPMTNNMPCRMRKLLIFCGTLAQKVCPSMGWQLLHPRASEHLLQIMVAHSAQGTMLEICY